MEPDEYATLVTVLNYKDIERILNVGEFLYEITEYAEYLGRELAKFVYENTYFDDDKFLIPKKFTSIVGESLIKLDECINSSERYLKRHIPYFLKVIIRWSNYRISEFIRLIYLIYHEQYLIIYKDAEGNLKVRK